LRRLLVFLIEPDESDKRILNSPCGVLDAVKGKDVALCGYPGLFEGPGSFCFFLGGFIEGGEILINGVVDLVVLLDSDVAGGEKTSVQFLVLFDSCLNAGLDVLFSLDDCGPGCCRGFTGGSCRLTPVLNLDNEPGFFSPQRLKKLFFILPISPRVLGLGYFFPDLNQPVFHEGHTAQDFILPDLHVCRIGYQPAGKRLVLRGGDDSQALNTPDHITDTLDGRGCSLSKPAKEADNSILVLKDDSCQIADIPGDILGNDLIVFNPPFLEITDKPFHLWGKFCTNCKSHLGQDIATDIHLRGESLARLCRLNFKSCAALHLIVGKTQGIVEHAGINRHGRKNFQNLFTLQTKHFKGLGSGHAALDPSRQCR